MAKAKRKPARHAQPVDPAVAQMAERLRAITIEHVPVFERALLGALSQQLSSPLLPMLDQMDQGMRLFAAFELALHAATTEGVEAEDACPEDEEVARYRARLVEVLHAFGARRDGPERLVTRLAGIGVRQLEHPSKGPAELVIRVWAWFLLGVTAGVDRHAEPEDWMLPAILQAARGWAEQMAAAAEAAAEAEGILPVGQATLEAVGEVSTDIAAAEVGADDPDAGPPSG